MSDGTQRALTEAEIVAVSSHVASWWTDRLMRGDKEKFRAFLADHVAAELRSNPDRPYIHLECDYDPHGALLEAVRAAGVECRGFMFSGDDILPREHSTDIHPARVAEPKYEQEAAPARFIAKTGYGNWADPIPLAELARGASNA